MVVLGFACRLVAVEHIVNFFKPIWPKVRRSLGSSRKRPPDAVTVRRVLEGVDRQEFEEAFRAWVKSLVEGKDLTAAVDGKVLKNCSCQKVLNVFAHDIKLTLAQEDIANDSGESTTLRDKLAKLFADYPGLSILTGDSAYCGRDFCQAIKDAGRHYIVQVKGNQAGLYEQMVKWFEEDTANRDPDAVVVKKNRVRRRSEKSGS
jgi:hypothetical protein